MQILDELEQRQAEQREANRKRMNPAILAFIDELRLVFGPVTGTQFAKPDRWPGGTNVKWCKR